MTKMCVRPLYSLYAIEKNEAQMFAQKFSSFFVHRNCFVGVADISIRFRVCVCTCVGMATNSIFKDVICNVYTHFVVLFTVYSLRILSKIHSTTFFRIHPIQYTAI